MYRRQTKYLPFKENTPQWDASDYDYALEKVRAEQVFIDAFEKNAFPVTIIRPAYTYDTIVPVALGHNCFTAPQRYLDGKPVLIAGDGTNLITLTHSKDFANACLGLLGNSAALGEDFHITSDEWLTWLDLTQQLLETLGLPSNPDQWMHIPIQHILSLRVPPSKNIGISSLGPAFKGQRMWCDIYDNSKIKKIIPGWQATIPFSQGIRETITWLYEKDARRRFNPDLDAILEDMTRQFS
ncbi:MAG: hypothetical protein DELT_01466 [Desulfovibrio sp.]